MRRVIIGIVGVYLLAAIVTRAAEEAGVGPRQCGCEPDCWCKRPGLTVFRWVTPKGRHHLLSPADKRMLAEAQISN
jgi:hypothetical protein